VSRAFDPCLNCSIWNTLPLRGLNVELEDVRAHLSATPSAACSSDCTVPQRMHMPLMKPGWGGHCAATTRAGGTDVTRASGAGRSPIATFAAVL